MAGLRPIGRSIGPDRDLYIGSLADAAETQSWPQRFVAFTALDAAALTDEQLCRFARRLLGNGCIYSCSWGPESGRVETAFDVETARAEVAGRPYADPVMTTSHEDEALDEALWFALFAAFPPDGDAGAVVTIVDDRWRAEVEIRLADSERFNADVMARDEGAGGV